MIFSFIFKISLFLAVCQLPHFFVVTEKNQTYNDCYFIYYGSGIEPLPWRPWFEFLVYQSKDKTVLKQDPTVEIGFASHHFSDTPIIPVPEQTEAIRSITKDLHDWVMQISWVSAYKSYLF